MNLALMKSSPTILFCFLLTSIVVFPFFLIGEDPGNGCCGGETPVTHDGAMHLNQMQSFERGLSAGRVYPRWDAETHQGYGAPTTSFYPPGAYYLTSFFYWLIGNWQRTQAAFYWAAMAFSGLAIYWYARQAMTSGASLIAMAVYLVAPYHLINQYQRGALAEQLSFIWAPLMLFFIERLLKGEDRSMSFAALAATFGAFLWSHPATAYQFVLVFGLIFGLSFALNFYQAARTNSLLILVALLFGSMLAAAYFFPAMIEQPLINADDVEISWPYQASYVFDEDQKYYDHRDDFVTRIDRSWAFSAIVLVCCGLFAGQLSDRRTRIWLMAAGLATFLMTKYSSPVGRLIPKIEIGVFSWRMLTITSLSIALLAGALWQLNGVKRMGRVTATLILLASIGMSGWYVIKPMYRAEAFRARPGHYNYVTLPRGVPRILPEMNAVQLADGRFTIEQWRPELRQVQVELDQADQVQFRLSNFPGWTAIVNGAVAEIAQRDDGSVALDLPAGKHQVTLDFRSTPIRKISNWITIVSFSILISLSIFALRRKR